MADGKLTVRFVRRRKLPFEIRVCEHARHRARERFPGFKAARIVDEVRDAFVELRVSPRKPQGCTGGDYQGALYAWTPDGCRVYVVMATPVAMDVVTTIRVGG